MNSLILLLSFPLVFAKGYTIKKMVFDNGKTVEVEIADTVLKRTKGLMNRTSLDQNKGMLFVFNEATKQSFWNKNTFIPLDLAYFDKDMVLKEIYPLEAVSMMEKVQDTKTYPSKCLCQYVLEVNQGWFKRNKVKIGSKFQLKEK